MARRSAAAAVDDRRLVEALKQLDPVSRALLDLSLRRGIPDDQIASVVGTDPERVAERRDDVLRELADALGLDGSAEELVRVSDALKQIDWRAHPRTETRPGAPPGEAERQGTPERAGTPTELGAAGAEPESRNVWIVIAALVLSAVALRRRSSP